jgi:tetratricopeptide (TPR) repeat protein
MADRPGRNDACPCGSGKKYKRCCGAGATAPPRPSAPVDGLAQRGEQCFTLGLALERAGDIGGALAAHRRAIELDPTLAPAHARVGDLLMGGGKRDAAAAAYERASAASRDTTLGRLCEAKALILRERAVEAQQRLRALIARDASSAEAHLVLGLVLNEAGSFDAAAASFERSIALSPLQATAYHGLVSSRRLTEGDRPLVTRILARLDGPPMTESQRMTLHFAAGKALDDLKDYAGAIRHFDAANAIRRRLSPFVRADFERLVDRLIARFTAELFSSHAGDGDGDETPVLVLGMPRSGTTLIERILSSHPAVAGGGELGFWNEHAPVWAEADVDAIAGAADRLRGDYRQVLRRIGPRALRVTDKMPFNFLWIGLVHLVLPRARVVHVRRNPLDTCLSIYQTQFAQSWGFASDRGDLAAYYRQYRRLMDHWRGVLPPDRLIEVDYEAATGEPDATARRLVAFCGLPWDAACSSPERNPDAVRTASKWQARQPIYRSSVERWRHYEPWLGELRTL